MHAMDDPEDFRRRMVDAYEAGRVSSYREAGEIFGVGHATAARWIRQFRRAGDVAPQPMGGLRIPRLIGEEGDAFIKAQLLAAPTLVASELCRLYEQRFGVSVSEATMKRNIRELGFTVKKGRRRPPEKDRIDVVEKRALFDWLGSRLPARRLVVVDESGVELGAPTRLARSMKGTRAHVEAPVRGKRLSMVGAVRLEGLVDLQLFEGHSDTQLFEHWTCNHLAPKLRPGDIVLMDNSSIHKSQATRTAIEEVGAELVFLPPYSPEYSPIESFWGKLKHLTRRLAARTTDLMVKAAAEALTAITDEDFRAWFRHCGWTQLE